MAVLQFDNEFTIPLIPAGSFQPVSISMIPSSQVIMHGCVRTFFNAAFLLLVSVKTESPDDHIIILIGIR